MQKLFSSFLFRSFFTTQQSFYSKSNTLSLDPIKRVPISVTNFGDLIDPENNYAFIDKTLLIKSILAKKKNYLILRPEGWGKTTNLSMLHSFFSINNKNSPLANVFSKLRIGEEESGRYLSEFAFKYSVIQLDFYLQYDSNPSLIDVFNSFIFAIRESYIKHNYLINSPHLSQEEKTYIKMICENNIDQIPDENIENIIRSSINKLSEFIYKHQRTQSIILIDNYDSPANLAMMEGIYNEVLNIMQQFFTQTLDENKNLSQAVIAGTMPITKAYIFPSLKSINSFTFLNEGFEEFYGFNEDEVKGLISKVTNDSKDLFKLIYMNYKGYYSHIAQRKRIYQPSSILRFLKTEGLNHLWKSEQEKSELNLIYYLYTRSSPHDFQDIKDLTDQKFSMVERRVHWHIIDKFTSHPQRRGLFYNPVKIWSVLLYTGYLTLLAPPKKTGTHYDCQLQIPNKEVLELFKYFQQRNRQERTDLLSEMRFALKTKNPKLFFRTCTIALRQRILWENYPRWNFERERHYHDYLEVVIDQLNLKDFELISEEKSGAGRVDIILLPKGNSDIDFAYIFELKYTEEQSRIRSMIGRALFQIKDRDYISRIISERHVKEVIFVGVVGTDKRVFHIVSTTTLNEREVKNIN